MTSQTLLNETLVELAARYDFNGDGLELIRDVNNPVYSVNVGGQPSILRLSSADKRTRSVIEGELERMQFLQRNGVGVPEVRPYVQHVWDLMLDGYQQEYSLADEWLAAMPLFLRFRVMQDYVHGLRELASGSPDEWLVAFLRKQRYIIEHEVIFSHIRWL